MRLRSSKWLLLLAIGLVGSAILTLQTQQTAAKSGKCSPAYPDVCIAPAPPDLDCKHIPHRRFRVLPPDPHRFDGDKDGIGCEAL